MRAKNSDVRVQNTLRMIAVSSNDDLVKQIALDELGETAQQAAFKLTKDYGSEFSEPLHLLRRTVMLHVIAAKENI